MTINKKYKNIVNMAQKLNFHKINKFTLICCFAIFAIIIGAWLFNHNKYFLEQFENNNIKTTIPHTFNFNHIDLHTRENDIDAMQTVYCFWTGNNEMSSNRKKCINSIRKNIGCQVILITPDNLSNYISHKYPLHRSYEYLSYTHKADYLRTYMMHVHGGGYTDIKETTISWLPYFKQLNDDKNKWAIGYKEIGAGGVACNTNCEEVIRNWDKLIGNGCYIFKKQTPLTSDWFNGMNAKLDEKYELLKANPAQAPDDVPGKEIILSDGTKINSQYPMGWSEMLGGIFHPICYKYHDRLLNTLPPPIFSNYR